MSRIAAKFDSLKAQGRKAFVSYIMAYDPDAETTAMLLEEMPKAGVDIIELGMPFSDPMAEGPTIQRAAARALKSKCGIKQCFELVKQFRQGNDETPIILMGYFNPVFVYGSEKFVKDAKKNGVDGVIIVDLPAEEDEEFIKFSKSELDFIKLTSPTTTKLRAKKILNNSSGFVYYVSVAGVTGVKEANEDSVKTAIELLREQTDLPICIGFGIKTPEKAKALAPMADGIVIGSAFIDIIEKNLNDRQKAVADCMTLAISVRNAIDSNILN